VLETLTASLGEGDDDLRPPQPSAAKTVARGGGDLVQSADVLLTCQTTDSLRMEVALNTIHHGDCLQLLARMPAGSGDLAFAHPPFKIRYGFDVCDDRKEHEHYLDWSRQWIAGVHRVLKPDGTFWLAIGDEYAAELKLESQKIGFHTRSWVIWYYTFGVNCNRKFTRSHAHLFYFVKDPANFTFRENDLANRIP